MSWMAWIPWLDIFLGVLFVGLIAIGFWQGLLRELWFLLSLYLAAILASLYGDLVGSLIWRGVGSGSETVASAWGFLIVMFLATIILFSVIHLLFGHLRLQTRLLVLDKVGGVALGVITSFVVVSFIAFVLKAVLSIEGLEQWAFIEILQKQSTTSPLLQVFVGTRGVVMALVAPWLPELPRFMQTP